MAAPAPWTLRDGTALITGAASGIGAALAEALARRGMHLALADRQAAALEAVATRCRPRSGIARRWAAATRRPCSMPSSTWRSSGTDGRRT